MIVEKFFVFFLVVSQSFFVLGCKKEDNDSLLLSRGESQITEHSRQYKSLRIKLLNQQTAYSSHEGLNDEPYRKNAVKEIQSIKKQLEFLLPDVGDDPSLNADIRLCDDLLAKLHEGK